MGHGISGESTWRRSRIVVPVASPAAGSDWSLVVPSGHVYRLLAVAAQLVTSAVVATRSVRLNVSDGVRTFLSVPPGATQAASLTRLYSWLPSVGFGAFGLAIGSNLPDLDLAAGWSIGTTTEAVDVGDQWSAVFVHVMDVTTRQGAIELDGVPDMIVSLVDPGPPGVPGV